MTPDTLDRSETDDRRILVVEDDRSLVVLVVYMLSHEGYQVSSVSDGTQALAVIRQLKPALIVLDLGLPGLSGDEICKAIRRDPELASTFVLVLTALDDHQARRRVREAGADCYMCKPFDPERLVRVVESVLASGPNAAATADAPAFELP